MMHTKNKLVLVVAVIAIYAFLYYVVYRKCTRPSISSYTILAEHNHDRLIERQDGTTTRYVLLYTSFFREQRWGLLAETLGPDYFAAKHCPVKDCVLTSNHDLLPSVTDYDALVFHVASGWDRPLPKVRKPSQVYVAALMESPAHTKHELTLDAYYFNWTMTYRLDSDVLFNYQNIVDLESGEYIGPALHPSWRNGFDAYANESFAQRLTGKSKLAVQFVSHCDALSGRDRLVQKMQSVGLQVDVYGSCGPLRCPRGNPECDKMLDSVYWFYLSFENSLCVDYVTEKLYNALEHDIVPVVFGGADYGRFMPPGSYIDVQDYPTVDALADYLLYLVDNPHEYVKYFWWKDHYAPASTNSFCDLCQRLHSVDARQKVQYYRDIKSWWFDDACIAEPNIAF